MLVLVLHRGAVTVSSAGPRGLFKGMTTATSVVIARFPLLLPVRTNLIKEAHNSQKSYMRYMTVLDILLRLKTLTEMLNEEDISRMNYYKL